MSNKKTGTYLWLALLVFSVNGCSKKSQETGAPQTLKISGTIELDPALAKNTSPRDVIYLIARTAEGGHPVAVQRFEGNSYPYAFELTEANLMTAAGDFTPAPLNLSARVDKDGDAMSKTPGDLIGTYGKNPVAVQTAGVVLVLNEVLK